METTHTAVLIANALADHQGTWDSWGWSCPCGAGAILVERGTPMETHEQVTANSRAKDAREALLLHQGDKAAEYLS